MRCGEIVYTEHAAKRAIMRAVGKNEVREVIELGEVVQVEEDTPGPVYVMDGDVSGKRLRVVFRRDEDYTCYVITVFPRKTVT